MQTCGGLEGQTKDWYSIYYNINYYLVQTPLVNVLLLYFISVAKQAEGLFEDELMRLFRAKRLLKNF